MDWEDDEEAVNLDDKISYIQSISQSEAKNVLQSAEEEVRDFLEGFSLTEEEAVVDEVEKLLAELSSQSDMSARINEDRHVKLESALRKCMLVFTKQKVRDFAAADVDVAPRLAALPSSNVDEAKKSEPKRTGTSAADALMIQMLQRKVVSLKKNIELSDQKARTVNLQWISDKARYKEMLEKSQQMQDELRTRLQIMERKARKLEQLDRDSNQIKTQPSEIKELETVKETLANVESELSEKKQFITSLSVELSDKKLELSTAETKLEALTRRLEELAKSEEQLHIQLESFEKDSRNAMFKISDLQRDLSDAKVELEEEKIASQRYRDRLEQQQAEFDEKITGYRNKIDELRQLVERIMDEKEALFREGTTKADVLQRENGKLNQEKEALARNLKSVTSALQAIAKDMQQLSTQMQQRDRQVVKQIEDNVRSADFLKGEVKRLGTTVADLTTSSNSKIEEAKRQMLDQLESSASNLRMANAKFELANNEIQELRANAAKAAEEWARERLKMQHDFDNASQTIQSLNEEIQKLKSGSRGLSQEEVDEIVESQKAAFREKMADMRAQSDAVIVELRDAKDKIKLISDDNTELARRLSLLKEENLRISLELDRASMSREDFFHYYSRSVDVHDCFVAKTEKKIAELTEQHEATAAELTRVSDELATAKATVHEKIVYTAAPSDGVVSVAVAAAETSEAGVQTDPMKAERERRHDDIQVIPGEEIVYGKIEALVKESLVTSNLYFSKESETFSNTYPIDENFLKDLVNSFVNMAQGIREMAKQVRAKDIESIVSAVAKDLIFKLDKARDESVLKIKAEQADVMAERIDETIQMMRRDKEAALYEQKESFERELAMAKSRTDKEIKRFEDMLSDQREMFRKELRKAREQWEQELEIDDHVMLPSFSSEPNLDIFNAEPDPVAPAEPQQDSATTEQKDIGAEENKLRASMVGVLRRAKSSKRGSSLAGREADLEILKAQWKIEFEDAIRDEVRKDVEAEMNARQLQQKMHMMKENGLEEDEVDRQILELWKELPDRFKDMDLAQMKNELLNGSLSHIGDVRMENFDRLRNRGFGTDDIIQLTIIEHHMRYDGGDKNDDGTPLSAQQARQYKMQLKTMEIQRNMLLHRVVQQTNILDLLSYLHATDVHMQLLSTLNAWRSLLYYSAGGIFKDVLAVHLEVLEKCIKSSGGLKAAMSNLSFMSPDSPTDQWPQYFRVKALELFRSQLMTEARDLKRSMASALKFLQDKNTLTVLHGVKLNSTLQDAVALEQKSEDPAKRLKADHQKVLTQLKKTYHAVSSIVVNDAPDDDTAASESKDAFGDISIDLRSTSSMEASESAPAQALSGRQEDHITPIVSARNSSSQRPANLKAQESFRGTPRVAHEMAPSLKQAKVPSSSRLTQNAEATTASMSPAAASTVVSAKVTQPPNRPVVKDAKRSDSLAEKSKPSGSSQTTALASKPTVPQQSVTVTTSLPQQSNTLTSATNQKSTLSVTANPSATQKPAAITPPASALLVTAKPVVSSTSAVQVKSDTLLSPSTKPLQITPQPPARVKNVDEIKDLKKTTAPDLRRLAFEETFAYESSSVANEVKQVDETAPVAVKPTIIAPFHPILDEILLQAVQGDSKSKAILLSIDEAFKQLNKGDRVGCNGTLNALSNHGDLQEVVRYVQRDVSLERSSSLIDDVRSKILKFVAILEKQDAQKASSIQPAIPQPRLSMIPVDLPPVSVTASTHQPASSLFPSTQMFDCATQTPVYKESTIVGHKSKSRRPERSTRVNEVYVPSQDRAEDDSRRKGLPPGFILANFRDDEFEVAPGLYLVKLSTVESTLRNQPEHLNPDQSVDELTKKVSNLPSNVFYCRGSKDSPEAQDLKSADFVLDLPVVDGCFPLLFPSVFPLQQGANLITGFQYIGQGNEYVFGNLKYNQQRNSSAEIVSLPHDLLLLQIADDLPLPYGIYPVQISPRLVVSDDCSSTTELMATIRDQIPPSHELVQILGCAIDFPVGLEIAPGIKIAATPLGLVLPECVRLVKKEKSTPLPEFMVPIKFMPSTDETGPRPMLRNGCMVVEKPKEFFFDLGMEIIYRPPGFALPPSTRLVPIDEYPPDFALPPNHDLIQLEPLFDLPEGARLTPSWLFCKRPFTVQLPSNYYFVHPDFSLDDHSIPPLPHYACIMPMPALPPGVVLPPRSKLVKLNIARLTPFPLPEGAILGPGLIVVNPQKTHEGHVCELRRPAVNALVVRRDPDSPLPPGVQRGSRSDLPNGVLLEEHMEVVRIPVRFELPIGVKLDSNVVLGANVQLAPGTRLQSGVTQMGNRAAPYLTVLPWPHGVTLPRGTELVKRIPSSIPLPFEFQIVHHCDTHAIPPDAMVVQLPKKLYLPSLLEISEQIVFGVESVLDSFHRALPAGMVLVSRQSSNAQWPPELTPVHHRELPKKLAQLLEQREKDAANSLSDSYQAFKSATRRPGLQVRMNINIEVARLRAQIDFPGGVEIVQGVVTLSRPYWAMPIHNVALVQLPETGTEEAQSRLEAHGFYKVRLRSEVASSQYVVAPRTASSRAVSRASTAPTTASAVDWSLPPRSIFVQLPEVFDVYSWRDVLPGVESVSHIEGTHGMALPPSHFLIQRPRHRLNEELPAGFQLGISEEYRNMRLLTLPPQVEIMHIVPVRYLPRGVNIINTSVLTKNSYNNMTGAMFMGLGGTTYTKKLFDPRWIPRMSPFEPISSKAVVLPWPENACRMESILDYFREGNMLLFVRDQVSQRPSTGDEDGDQSRGSSLEKNYPSNIVKQRESDLVVTSLHKIIGDPQKDSFLLNVPTDFSQQSLDRGIPVCKIELVQISDGFPSPVDRMKAPQKNTHSHANMRHLATVSEEATVFPRISRIKRQDFIDPAIELNRFLSEVSVFLFGKSEKDVKRELDHLGFDFIERGIDKLMLSIEQLKENCQRLEGDLQQERGENQRLQGEIDSLSEQVHALQVAVQTDDDLRAIIEKLKSLLADKDAEAKRLREMTTEVQERLQRQVDVLTTQIAQQGQEEEDKREQQLASLKAQLEQQLQQRSSYENLVPTVSSALALYGGVVSAFVQDFVSSWCEASSSLGSSYEAIVTSALQAAIEKRQKLQLGPIAVEAGKLSSPPRPAVRLASSLEDDDANESIGWQSASVSFPSHSMSDLVADARGKPLSVSESFPLDVRSLYKTAEMLPSAEFLNFSKAVKPKTKRGTQVSQSASLPVLPPLTSMHADAMSLASDFSRASHDSAVAKRTEVQIVAPLSTEPTVNESVVDTKALLVAVDEFFRLSTEALRSRACTDPVAFVAAPSADLLAGLRGETDESKRLVQEKCRTALERLAKSRDQATINTIAALECENQLLFMHHLQLSAAGHRVIRDAGSVASDLRFRDDDIDGASTIDRSTVFEGLDEGPSVSLEKKANKLRDLESTILKYENQLFKAGLSPVENLAKHLQEVQHLRQQLKLTLLLLRRRCRTEEVFVGDKRGSDGRRLESHHSQSEIDPDLRAKEVKAAKFRISRLTKQIALVEERLSFVDQDIRQTMVSILDHVESYQRCVQSLLPPRMFHQFLTKSAQYYDKMRNLTQDSLSNPSGSVLSISSGSVSTGIEGIRSRALPVLPTASSSTSSMPPHVLDGRVVGGIGTMPASNSAVHLRGKLRPSSVAQSGAFRNAAPILPSLR